MPLNVVFLLGFTSWFGFYPQRGLGSAQALDLIVVLDGGSSRLRVAEPIREHILHGDIQRGLCHALNLLLVRCPSQLAVPQPMQDLMQGYDTATQITALAAWLQQRLVPPPRRVWIAEHITHSTLLARIALAGRRPTSQAG